MNLWDNAEYRRRSQALRDAAYSNVNAACFWCGQTLRDGPSHRNGKPPSWHSDHLLAGNPRSPLVLSHSSCNQRRAGQASARRRKAEPRSPNG